jgi:tRNA (guanine37-N1)-methyltransferase
VVFNVLTLFPEMFQALNHSIIGRAEEEGLISVNPVNIRDFSSNKHKKVDDYPYGGGAGMVMQIQPIKDALASLKNKGKVIFMTPKGQVFDQDLAKELSNEADLTILCGHYEGVDQRVIDEYVDMEISLGDFVLTGGELAAMTMIDAVSRLKEGVLGRNVSYEDESHYNILLEYNHYTRPGDYDGMTVPAVLLSGNHKLIAEHRLMESIRITHERRPDLFDEWRKSDLSKEERKILKKYLDNL